VEARGEGRLGHEHRLGGTTHIAAASDLEEPLDLSKQHTLAIEVFYDGVKGERYRPMGAPTLASPASGGGVNAALPKGWEYLGMTHVTRNS
jgi:hypothetical protein